MSQKNPLINIPFDLGELSKPVTVFIKKVSKAIGHAYAPAHLTRMARAQVEVDKIVSLGKIEVSEIERRAVKRLIAEEGEKQANIEFITGQAAAQISNDAKPENMDDDWIANFFDKCRIVSDKQMQTLWAKLLAGEANSPGRYSKRTVNFIPNLERSDANLFTELCCYGWHIGALMPVVYDEQDEIYTKRGIDFTALQHLDDIGLISFNSAGGYKQTGIGREFAVGYYNGIVRLQFQNDKDNTLDTGKTIFTHVGRELAPICGSKPSNEFLHYVLDKWVGRGLAPYSPLGNIAGAR